jgi:hypothetical protein
VVAGDHHHPPHAGTAELTEGAGGVGTDRVVDGQRAGQPAVDGDEGGGEPFQGAAPPQPAGPRRHGLAGHGPRGLADRDQAAADAAADALAGLLGDLGGEVERLAAVGGRTHDRAGQRQEPGHHGQGEDAVAQLVRAGQPRPEAAGQPGQRHRQQRGGPPARRDPGPHGPQPGRRPPPAQGSIAPLGGCRQALRRLAAMLPRWLAARPLDGTMGSSSPESGEQRAGTEPHPRRQGDRRPWQGHPRGRRELGDDREALPVHPGRVDRGAAPGLPGAAVHHRRRRRVHQRRDPVRRDDPAAGGRRHPVPRRAGPPGHHPRDQGRQGRQGPGRLPGREDHRGPGRPPWTADRVPRARRQVHQVAGGHRHRRRHPDPHLHRRQRRGARRRPGWCRSSSRRC